MYEVGWLSDLAPVVQAAVRYATITPQSRLSTAIRQLDASGYRAKRLERELMRTARFELRVVIVAALRRRPCSTAALGRELDVSTDAVAHHINVAARVGLVAPTRERGKRNARIYAATPLAGMWLRAVDAGAAPHRETAVRWRSEARPYVTIVPERRPGR